jgi:hypothetical protein
LPAGELAQEDRGDEKTGNDEEDVDADESARETFRKRVKTR